MRTARVHCLYLLFSLVVFYPISMFAQIAGSASVCRNASTLYEVSSGDVVSWSVSGNNAFSHLANDKLQVLWKESGASVVTAIVQTPQSGLVTQTFNVMVNGLPTPSITPLNTNLCTTILPNAEKGKVSDVCYAVCDSAWFVFKGNPSTSGSSFSWLSTGNAQIVPLNTNADSVKVRWFGSGYTDLMVSELSPTGCVGTEHICVQVQQNPTACLVSTPVASSSGEINLCLNSELSLNASCAYSASGSAIKSYRWILGDGTIVNSGTFVKHTYQAAGQYNLQLIVETNCGCLDTFFRTVTVSQSAGPDIFCVNSVCHNSTSTFSTSDACASLLWSVTGGSIVGSTTNDTVTVEWGNGNSGYGAITLQSSCSGSCPYPTQVYVPILPENATIVGENVVCNNAPYTYSVPFVPTTIYNWYRCTGTAPNYTCSQILGGYSNSIAQSWLSFSGSTLPEQKFTLKVTYENPFLGCTGTSYLPITVADKLTLTGDTLLCFGQTNTLIAWANGIKRDSEWKLFDYATNTTTLINANAHTVILSGLAVGYYKIVATSIDPNFCGNPATLNIRVLALPDAPTAPIIGPDTVCINTLATYATGPTTAGNYLEWEAASGSPTLGTGTQFSTIWGTFTTTTLKLRNVQIAEPGCASTWVTKTIHRDFNVLPNIQGANNLCGDDTASYHIGVLADDIEWSITPATSGSVVSGQYTTSPHIQWNRNATASNITATLTAKVIKCGQTSTKTYTITVKPSPVATIQATTAPFCKNETVSFSTSTTGSSFVWSFGDGNSATTSTATTTHPYLSDGSYPVKLTILNPNGCGTPVPTATTIAVLPGPVGFLSTPDPLNYCNVSSYTVNLVTTIQAISGNTYTYQLYKNNTAQSSNSTGLFSVTQTGAYKVLVTNTTLGCSDTTNVLSVTDDCGGGNNGCTPTGTVSLSLSHTCGEATATTTLSSGVTLNSIHFEDALNSSNIYTNSPANHDFTQAGHYRVVAYATSPASGGGTCPVTDEAWITVDMVPDFTIQYACSSNVMTTNLVNTSTHIGSVPTINWVLNGTSISPSNQANHALALAPGSGTARIELTKGSNTCSILKNLNVPAPAVANYTSLDKVCESEAVHFTSTATGNIVSYLWDYGGGATSSLVNSSKVFECTTNPMVNPIHCGKPTIYTVTDLYGCSSIKQGLDTVYDDKLANQSLQYSFNNVILCGGQDTTYEVFMSNITTSPFVLYWSTGLVQTVSTSPLTFALNNSGTYNVLINDKYGCRKKSETASVIYDNINAQIVGDSIFCKGDKMNLSLFQGYNYTYAWWHKDSLTNTVQQVTGLSKPFLLDLTMDKSLPPAANYDGDLFWGIVTSPNGCSDTVGPVVVRQYQEVTPSTSISVVPLPPCTNQGPVTIALSSPNAWGYLWNNGILSNSLTLYSPGTYAYQMIDTNGCRKNQLELTVPGGPDFSQLISGCYTRCLGSNTVLYGPLAPQFHNYTYTWLLNDTGVVATTPDATVTQSGTYTLVIEDEFNSIVCSDTSAPIYLTLQPCPNNYCAESLEASCVGCFEDSATDTRYLSVLLKFNFIPNNGLVPYSFFSNTAQVFEGSNKVNWGGQLTDIGENVLHGWNNIKVDIADLSPFQTNHTIYLIINDCHIPITITTPPNCTNN